MTYAPVCIPTLNRYEHLRKCLESLSRCTWADRTEVYVALDYPPANQWDKYAPGWEKNREFLRSCGNMGFKKLHVIEREENYGTWMPGDKGNAKYLIEQVSIEYNYYIYSEDDNVFAPCFLEYMNKGFVLFENDDNVYSIGGYRFYYPIKTDSNDFIRQSVDYSPWGVGCWTKKVDNKPLLDYLWYRTQFSIEKFFDLWMKYGLGVICAWFSHCIKHAQPEQEIDNYIWTYMNLSNRQQIIPTKTLVHNIGLDGSGVDMHDASGSKEEWCDPALNPLSTDAHFEFVGTGYEHFEENRKIYYHGKYWMTEWQYLKKACRKLVKLLING